MAVAPRTKDDDGDNSDDNYNDDCREAGANTSVGISTCGRKPRWEEGRGRDEERRSNKRRGRRQDTIFQLRLGRTKSERKKATTRRRRRRRRREEDNETVTAMADDYARTRTTTTTTAMTQCLHRWRRSGTRQGDEDDEGNGGNKTKAEGLQHYGHLC